MLLGDFDRRLVECKPISVDGPEVIFEVNDLRGRVMEKGVEQDRGC